MTLLVVFILLFSAYCYAQDDPIAGAEDNSGSTTTEQVVVNTDADPEADIDIEGSIADSNEIYGSSAEDPDMYEYGTAQRELNVQDYGVGDLGEDSLE